MRLCRRAVIRIREIGEAADRYRGSVARIADDHGARQIGINLRASTRIETVQHAVVRGDPDDRCARSLAVGEGRVCAGARERLAVEQIRIGCADIDRLRIDDIAQYGREVAKIGRESWRERESQYVEISEGRV